MWAFAANEAVTQVLKDPIPAKCTSMGSSASVEHFQEVEAQIKQKRE